VGAGSAGAGLEFELFVESETPPHAVRATIAKTTRTESEIVLFFIFFSLSNDYPVYYWMNATRIIDKKDLFDFIRGISRPYGFLKSVGFKTDAHRYILHSGLHPL
jgi:hypothetical protein